MRPHFGRDVASRLSPSFLTLHAIISLGRNVLRTETSAAERKRTVTVTSEELVILVRVLAAVVVPSAATGSATPASPNAIAAYAARVAVAA
jgi:hypothetical protein